MWSGRRWCTSSIRRGMFGEVCWVHVSPLRCAPGRYVRAIEFPWSVPLGRALEVLFSPFPGQPAQPEHMSSRVPS